MQLLKKVSFKRKHLFIRNLALAVMLSTSFGSSAPALAESVVAQTKTIGLKTIANDPRILELIKQNKQEALAKGQARLELDSAYFNFHKSDLHSRAVSIIDRLEAAGFEAYLVGGAVRDLLSGKIPKDYDVITNALPEEICAIFENAHVVSKRFKIALLDFDDEKIEVTTFRTVKNRGHNTENHQLSSEGILLLDNDFSRNLADDAEHRDLTINGIYFDINKEKLIDFHGGISDLNEHLLEVVGDVETSYRENPVHLIRILRFAAKLGFTITPRSAAPIPKLLPLLKKINKNRMFGEVSKLFMSGHSIQSYKILTQYGAFKYLFPDLEQYLEEKDNVALLHAILQDQDERHATHSHEDSYEIYAELLWPKFEQEYKALLKKYKKASNSLQEPLLASTADKVLTPQLDVTNFKAPVYEKILNTWRLQLQLMQIDSSDEMKSVATSPEFKAAFSLFKARAKVDKSLSPYVTIWQPYYEL